MAIYYIEDKNGVCFSEDGKRRFTRLQRKKAYQFLISPEAKGGRFFRASNDPDTGEKLYAEIPAQQITSARRLDRREQYVEDCKKESGLTIISTNASNEEMLADEELIVDETVV